MPAPHRLRRPVENGTKRRARIAAQIVVQHEIDLAGCKQRPVISIEIMRHENAELPAGRFEGRQYRAVPAANRIDRIDGRIRCQCPGGQRTRCRIRAMPFADLGDTDSRVTFANHAATN